MRPPTCSAWSGSSIPPPCWSTTTIIGAGYAVVGEPEREAIRLMARHEGILLDPVYTGRAFAGLIDLIRQGELTSGQRVLFWHTGGTAALFAFAGDLL